MLDNDLAMLCQSDIGNLNKEMKRNYCLQFSRHTKNGENTEKSRDTLSTSCP